MNDLNLENYKVKEMDSDQLLEVHGGGWWPQIIAAYLISEWSDIKQAAYDAGHEYKYR